MYVQFDVTNKIIRRSKKLIAKNKKNNIYNYGQHCPIATAFNDFTKKFNKENKNFKIYLLYVSNGFVEIQYMFRYLKNNVWSLNYITYANLPHKAREFIVEFDFDNPVKEFSFKLNIKTKK